ncbi:MAG: hypothetical protein CSA33_05410 [Desulfobulbus propionicus]|nr:MAG: hypothetical protein CSA33_05410 [Desulfobulbus propionicus]
MQVQRSGLSFQRTNQKGSVAVVVALLLSVLVGIMAFTMDVGYLYYMRNKLQNSVEAVALAGVRHLCEEDMEERARTMAVENGLSDDSAQLEIIPGFYDARNEFAQDLGDYKDFGPPPEGRYDNAVLIRHTQTVPSLTGMHKEVRLRAEAVAYLKRVDIASLDPEGYIHLGHKSSWENTVFLSNNKIEYPEDAVCDGKFYPTPEFTDCDFYTVNGVYSVGVTIVPSGWLWEDMIVEWDSASSPVQGNSSIAIEPLTGIRPVDEATLDYWYDRADTVYTPDQAGQDNVFYGIDYASFIGPNHCCFDLAAEPGTGRRVIFFDAGEDDDYQVLFSLRPPTSNVPHTPNGDTISGLTFIANCPINILNYLKPGNSNDQLKQHIGGKGEEQTIIICSEDIVSYTSRGAGTIYEGVVFRTGGDFIVEELTDWEVSHHLRVIADGSIYGKKYSNYRNDPGTIGLTNNAIFAPPCMTGMARLGRLEAADTGE